MKKIVTLFALTLGFSAAHAGVGVHGGVNFSNATTANPDINSTRLTGITLGGHYRLDLIDFFAIEPGIQLSTRGYTDTRANPDARIRILYLEVPVFAQARFKLETIEPFLAAGPLLGVKLGSSCSFVDSDIDCVVVDDSQIETFNTALQFGGGASVPVTNGAFTVQAFYTLGLTNFSKATTSYKHKGITIQVGYDFN